LTAWNKEARDHLFQDSALDDDDADIENKLRFVDIDNSLYHKDKQCNLFNVLHGAAEQADICLLARVVAMGAAIDYLTAKLSENATSNTEAAPRDATALLLACSGLAQFGSSSQGQRKKIPREHPIYARRQQGFLECAIQLVKLGADCNKVFKQSKVCNVLQSFNLDNNNAYQLAKFSKQFK
jgi:hypothetical protein